MSYGDKLLESAQNMIAFPGYVANQATGVAQHLVDIPLEFASQGVFEPWAGFGPRFKKAAAAAAPSATLGKKHAKKSHGKKAKSHAKKSHAKKSHAKKSKSHAKKSRSVMLRFRPKTAAGCKKRHMEFNHKTGRCNKSEKK